MSATIVRLKKMLPAVLAPPGEAGVPSRPPLNQLPAAATQFERGIPALEAQFLAHQAAVDEAMKSGKLATANAAISSAVLQFDAAVARLDELAIASRKKTLRIFAEDFAP